MKGVNMNKSLKTIFVLLVLVGSSQCLAQDKLSPIYFIELQKRTDDKTKTLKLDPIFTYIKPGANIKINFLKDKMRETIGFDSDILRKLESLNAIGDSLRKARDKAVAAEADSSKKIEIREKFESIITKQATKPKLELIKSKKEIKLTVKATIILKNGKTYDIEVPNYVNVIQKEDTTVIQKDDEDSTRIVSSPIVSSITQRVFRVSTKGLQDRIINTEIDVVQERLREGDMVKLEIETDDGGVKRKYIKRFVISEHGWKLEFPPSMLFIKRKDEPTDSTTGKAINPSDFKPAPGGSMLFSYKPKGGLGNQLLKGWSFGVNVSLLDFEVDNNLELGVGFIVYGLNRLVGTGYGWNLHASEKESYYFISLDFLRTFETFKAIFSPGEE